MKRAVFIGLVILVAFQLNGYSQKNTNQVKVKPDTIAVDSVEYELIVLDPGFDSWLATKPPENFYSKDYYKLKNTLYVTEWNYRYGNPIKFGSLYESRIDYDLFIDYGLDLNYRLYYYFLFFEETNHVKLLATGK
jgi:hypothetical protein